MTLLAPDKFGNFSEGLFQRLLVIYPKAHRDEYGPSMNQLFRDQSRDASREDGNWGLLKLWLRVFPDLLRTSLIEHLTALKERTMNERIHHLLRSPRAPVKVFVTAFAGVFVIVLAASVLITFILPETYAGTARIAMLMGVGEEDMLKPPDPYVTQTEFEVIQSDLILGKVVENLDLRAKWGKKYSDGMPIKQSEAVAALRARLNLRPIRNTRIIEIRAYSDTPDEAAWIANAVVESYCNHRFELHRRAAIERYKKDGVTPNPAIRDVDLIDRATPNPNYVRPRKALNIVVGAMLGIFLGLLIGGGTGGITFLLGRKLQKNPV